jgi:hypothetical protein
MSILNGTGVPCLHFVKLHRIGRPTSIQPKEGPNNLCERGQRFSGKERFPILPAQFFRAIKFAPLLRLHA